MDDAFSAFRTTVSSSIAELALFMCSFAPLFAILAIRFERPSLTIACAGLAVVGLGAGAAVLLRLRRITAGAWVVRTVEDRGGEVAGYLATYLLPFVTVTEPNVRDVLAYALFFLVVAVIYVRSGLVQINPTLYLFGWRLFAIEIGDGWSGYLLARRPVQRGQAIHAIRLTGRLFVIDAQRVPHAG